MVKLGSDIKAGEYKPKPTKSAKVPVRRADKRTLTSHRVGIANTRDKVVQQAIKIILEPLFEPIFSRNSHGFRFGKSCHSALKQIDHKWSNIVWLLEFDFEKTFSLFNNRLVMAQLANRFTDRRFLSLFWALLKTGLIFPLGLTDSRLELGEKMPRGSIISPLVANICLHQLDMWIDNYLVPEHTRNQSQPKKKLIKVSTKGKGPAESTTLVTSKEQISQQCLDLKQAERVGPDALFETNTKDKELHEETRVVTTDQAKVDYTLTTHLVYSRYSDNFILGFCGSNVEAKLIMQKYSGFAKWFSR